VANREKIEKVNMRKGDQVNTLLPDKELQKILLRRLIPYKPIKKTNLKTTSL
jgi:hypothetical protein